MKASQIIKLREDLRLTQTEFARRVGVHFTTVNRWENEKAKPGPLALDKLKSIAKKEGIDLTKPRRRREHRKRGRPPRRRREHRLRVDEPRNRPEYRKRQEPHRRREEPHRKREESRRRRKEVHGGKKEGHRRREEKHRVRQAAHRKRRD